MCIRDSVIDVLREYARLHLRLAPYLWTAAARMVGEGRPIQRPLGLAYPSLGVHPDDTYLLGSDLLVAPILDRGARTRDVILPPGAWTDWWTGARVEGAPLRGVAAPLDRLPLFLRAGALVPMLGPEIDAIEPSSDPRVRSFASGARELWWRGSTSDEASGEAYDGSRALVRPTASGAEVEVVAGSDDVGTITLELWAGPRTPSFAVEVDGAPLGETTGDFAASAPGWAFDDAGAGAANGGRLLIRVASGGPGVSHLVRIWR